jgi:hypothetical protein
MYDCGMGGFGNLWLAFVVNTPMKRKFNIEYGRLRQGAPVKRQWIFTI